MKTEDIQGTHTREATIIAVAQSSDDEQVVFRAPFDLEVTGVSVIFDTAVTGNDTNNFTASIINAELDGTGSVSVASLAFVTGTDAAQHDEVALTLSGTAANLLVDEDEVLIFSKVEAAAGLAQPGGLVVIEYEARGV